MFLFFFFILLFFPFSRSSDSNSNSTSIYDLLPKYGLPPGLLPDSVKSFSISKNGSFDVQLESKCYVEFDYLVYFHANISGVLKYGSIRDLKGIQTRKMLIWFDVDAIKVDLPPADYVYFEVGWITKKLKMDQFMDVHSCKNHKLLSELGEETSMLITE